AHVKSLPVSGIGGSKCIPGKGITQHRAVLFINDAVSVLITVADIAGFNLRCKRRMRSLSHFFSILEESVPFVGKIRIDGVSLTYQGVHISPIDVVLPPEVKQPGPGI